MFFILSGWNSKYKKESEGSPDNFLTRQRISSQGSALFSQPDRFGEAEDLSQQIEIERYKEQESSEPNEHYIEPEGVYFQVPDPFHRRIKMCPADPGGRDHKDWPVFTDNPLIDLQEIGRFAPVH